MATYFHGNREIQAADHGLQTVVLMNPAYLHQYSSDTTTHPPPPPPNNLLFLNSNSLSLPSPHTTQQFVGIPLRAASTTSVTNQVDPAASHDISSLHGLVHRLHSNFYNSINDPSGAAARETPRAPHHHQGQGLSLSLSNSQQQPAQTGYGSQAQAISGDHQDMRVSSGGSASSRSGVTTNNGVTGMQSHVLLSSKYLKAAQEVLDEVVSLNNSGILNTQLSKKSSGNNSNISSKAPGESSAEAADGPGDHGDAGGRKSSAVLTTVERQEMQMKKAKLMSMLDEVDQRYRQYHEQMQIVVSSFEQVAGIGSAKTYTALALKTISKQFRYLKDAISGQIQTANKSLGEEDCVGGKIEGSRLKFVDHHLRRQRALQQLGMIQHNAWRPQRGLPERSVSVLRAWLFEHFLHPYPKDSDKIMLAKQTGLTRSQVSNWFINARVRLWKPMVEEMYNEELKENEQNGSEDKTRNNQNQNQSNENSSSKSTTAEKSASENQTKSFSSEQDNNPSNQSISTASMPSLGGNVRNQSAGGFSVLGSSELECLTQGSPKKQRSTEMLQSPTSVQSINMDSIEQSEVVKNGYSFMGTNTNTNTNFMGSFGQYPAIGEMGRFDAEQFAPRFSGNGVSLTLGLPHCENLSLSGAHHQTFIPNQNMPMGTRLDIAIGEPNEYGAINPSTPHSNINIRNRKGFAAQLLPDFVA